MNWRVSWLCWLLLMITGAWSSPISRTTSSLTRKKEDYFVSQLPGYQGDMNDFPIMYSGKLPVDNGELFFWSIDAKKNDTDTLIFWLNGGPGCSSMDGLLMEIGPFRIPTKDNVQLFEHSWHEMADLVFVDQPIGTGFSTVQDDKLVDTLEEVGDDFVQMVQKYFEIFPEKARHRVFIAGESFAGQYIPYIADAILKSNDAENLFHVNLEGILIGNGWISPAPQYMSTMPFLYSKGLVVQGSDIEKRLQVASHNCQVDLEKFNGNIPVHVSKCENMVQQALNLIKPDNGKCLNMFDVRLADDTCGLSWPPDLASVTDYLARPDVFEALHIPDSIPWKECRSTVGGKLHFPQSKPSSSLLPALLQKIPILMFNGEEDFVCNHIGNENLIRDMEWSGSKGFNDATAIHSTWGESGKEYGTLQAARNLTYATIHKASHMAGFESGRQVKVLMNAFVFGHSWTGEKEAEADDHANNDNADGSEGDDKADDPNNDTDNSSTDEDEKSWNTYYKAGGYALIVVFIVFVIWAIAYWKIYGINLHDSHPVAKFFRGLSRWRPPIPVKLQTNPGGRYFSLNRHHAVDPNVIFEEPEEEELEEFEIRDH